MKTIERIIFLLLILGVHVTQTNAERHTPVVPQAQFMTRSSSNPADTACDEAGEYRQFWMDDATDRLYICFPSGWRRINTTPG